MVINKSILLIVLGCGLVTWLPRILPFILSKKIHFPKLLEDYLAFIPISILTALFIQSLLIKENNGFPSINLEKLIASLPTLLVAIKTKDLMWTVIVGMISMALLRYVALV